MLSCRVLLLARFAQWGLVFHLDMAASYILAVMYVGIPNLERAVRL
jgi:hypothetical protein